jgi:hypothetical protein
MINQHEGYLLIDHRNSPGVPESVAVKSGLDPRYLREGKILESATVQCAHCLAVVIKNMLRKRERAYCAKCNQYLCDWCDIARQAPDYTHICGEAVHDAIRELGLKGGNQGSPIDLLTQPKIIIP